jgi:hypothetical protein
MHVGIDESGMYEAATRIKDSPWTNDREDVPLKPYMGNASFLDGYSPRREDPPAAIHTKDARIGNQNIGIYFTHCHLKLPSTSRCEIMLLT